MARTPMMFWLAAGAGTPLSTICDATQRKRLIDRSTDETGDRPLFVLNGDVSEVNALIPVLQDEGADAIRYANLERIPEGTRVASTPFPHLESDLDSLLIKRNGLPKILGAPGRRQLWTDITKPAVRTYLSEHVAEQVTLAGADGVWIDSHHAELLPSTPYLDGAATAAAWAAGATSVLGDLQTLLGSRPVFFNGLWNHSYVGQVGVQGGMLSVCRGASVEFYGHNATGLSVGQGGQNLSDPFDIFVDQINAVIAANPTKRFFVHGTQADVYFDYAVDLSNARYAFCCYLLGARQSGSYFTYSQNFQVIRLARARANTFARHAYLDLDLGEPEGARASNGTGGWSRGYEHGRVYVAPDARGLQLWTLASDYYTTTGQRLSNGTTVALQAGDSAILLTQAPAPPPVSVWASPPPLINAIAPLPGVLPGRAGGFPSNFSTARATPIVFRYDAGADPGFGVAKITAEFSSAPGVSVPVYDGAGYLAPFTSSTTAQLGDVYTFSIRHDDGWPRGTIKLRLQVVDADGQWLVDPVTREYRYDKLRLRLRSTDVASAVRVRYETDDPGQLLPFGVLTIKPVGGSYTPPNADDRPYKTSTSLDALQVTASETYAIDGAFHSVTVTLPATCYRVISAAVVGAVEIDEIELTEPASIIPEIDPDAPIAYFTSVATLLSVQFTDGSIDNDGTIVSRLWDFGDGTTSTSTNPLHVYATVGAKAVTLTVTDDDGKVSTYSTTVNPTIKVDGPSRVYVPRSAADFAALSLPAPQHGGGADVASGNLVDTIGGGSLTLTANGSFTYRVSTGLAGWSDTGPQFTEAANQRFGASAGTGQAAASQDSMLILRVYLETPAASSGVMALGTNASVRHAPTTGRLRHVVGTPAQTKDGTAEYNQTVTLLALKNFPSVGVGGYETDINTPDAVAATPWGAAVNATWGIGSVSGTLPSFKGILLDWYLYVGDQTDFPSFEEFATALGWLNADIPGEEG